MVIIYRHGEASRAEEVSREAPYTNARWDDEDQGGERARGSESGVYTPADCLALLNRPIPRDKYTEAKPREYRPTLYNVAGRPADPALTAFIPRASPCASRATQNSITTADVRSDDVLLIIRSHL